MMNNILFSGRSGCPARTLVPFGGFVNTPGSAGLAGGLGDEPFAVPESLHLAGRVLYLPIELNKVRPRGVLKG